MTAADTAYPSCFVAALPRPVVPLAEICEVPPGEVGHRWFRTDYLHVTTHYLGWLSAAQVAAVQEVLAHGPPCPVRSLRLTGETDVVGPTDRRSLIAIIEPVTPLVEWRHQVARALADVGLTAAEPFRPHLTIARVSPCDLPARTPTIEPLELPLREVALCTGRTECDQLTHEAPLKGRDT
ncbi:hypothetical protein BH10ACT10_BH10ACT10_02130 [soil metagenome]